MQSPKAPPSPDPSVTAAAQSGMNLDTARASQLTNMIDQVTPDGSLKYNQTGSNTYVDSTGRTVTIPHFTATTTLSPDQKAMNSANNAAQTNIAGIARDQSVRIGTLLSTPLNFDSAPALYNPNLQGLSGNDYSADRQKVQDALMSRMQPQLDQDKAALETKLANQGVKVGSAAYDAAMHNYDSSTNDARMSAIINAGQEQSRLLSDEIQGTGFNNSVEEQKYNNSQGNRSNAIQEAMTLRETPINEISALLSGSQVSNPNFVNTPNTQVAGVNYAGLVQNKYNDDMAAYQSKVSQQNAMLGGLFGLAGTAATAGIGGPTAFSDYRLKRDIEQIGSGYKGLPVYSFRYVWDDEPQVGYLAHEVALVRPEAVFVMPSGYLAVDYRQLGA